jgi:hypothetical protein
MKYLSLLLLGAALSVRGFDTSRWLQLEALAGFGNSNCAECFDKIDLARDCLRECNQDAHPADNCCCCCECDKADDGLQGSDGQCEQDLDFKQCGDDFGQNCAWKLDDQANKNNRNKWYNLEDYCDCDTKEDISKDNQNNCREDDRKTNDRSLLDFCLGENGKSIDSVESIDDLKECCDFKDNKCDDYFTDVQECLVGCINPCLITSAGSWLDCLRANGDEGSCSRTQCLDGYLEDVPDDMGLDKNPDIFDLETVYKMVEKIHTEELEDCGLLKEFVDDVCDVSNDCCDRCSPEIGTTVDCLLNGIVVPFAEGALNATIGDCPIDTERCQADFRRLEEAKEPTAVSQESAAECQRVMETNIVAHNISYATNKFLECIMAEGFKALPDEETSSNPSGAVAVFSMFATALSFMTALLW